MRDECRILQVGREISQQLCKYIWIRAYTRKFPQCLNFVDPHRFNIYVLNKMTGLSIFPRGYIYTIPFITIAARIIQSSGNSFEDVKRE